MAFARGVFWCFLDGRFWCPPIFFLPPSGLGFSDVGFFPGEGGEGLDHPGTAGNLFSHGFG